MLHQYASSECVSKINIVIYLTPFKKVLPDNSIAILDVENANSAVTLACHNPGEIIIYRKEEWFKVFIHETFHSFGLDFSTLHCNTFITNFRGLFPISSTFNIAETYTEIWAEIINCVFISYFSAKDDFDLFLDYCEFLLQLERIFSLYQCQKILEYMGLEYKHLYSSDNNSVIARNNLYKEKTNIFAYYILKSLLMNNYIDFLKWCDVHNTAFVQFTKTENNLHFFFKYIKGKHNSTNFLLELENTSFLKVSSKLVKTMRMSVVEGI